MSGKIAIVYYSMYGHVAKLAQAAKSGVEAAGGKADLFQIPETLSAEVLTKMHAPAKDQTIPVATLQTLEEYDAFLFGLPTRYGNQSAQVRTFWDATGQLWAKGSLYQKPAGVFFSTGSQGGGQETTALNFMSTLVHHGMIFVPLGYARTPEFMDNSIVRGGSGWGAGTISGGDGSRQPSALELNVAKTQGNEFAQVVARLTSKP